MSMISVALGAGGSMGAFGIGSQLFRNKGRGHSGGGSHGFLGTSGGAPSQNTATPEGFSYNPWTQSYQNPMSNQSFVGQTGQDVDNNRVADFSFLSNDSSAPAPTPSQTSTFTPGPNTAAVPHGQQPPWGASGQLTGQSPWGAGFAGLPLAAMFGRGMFF